MEDFGGFIMLIIVLVGLFTIGLVFGETEYFSVDKEIVIHEVSQEEGHYKYVTSSFNFVSDSVYQVGDTIRIYNK